MKKIFFLNNIKNFLEIITSINSNFSQMTNTVSTMINMYNSFELNNAMIDHINSQTKLNQISKIVETIKVKEKIVEILRKKMI